MDESQELILSPSHVRNNRTEIPVIVPDNVEMGGRIASIKLCTAPLWKTIIRYLAYLLTAFILFLLNLWIPSLNIAMTYTDSNIRKAKWVIVKGPDGSRTIVPLIEERNSKHSLKVFTYRLFKYFYDEIEGVFQPCRFNIENVHFDDIHKDLVGGLDEMALKDNTILFEKNSTDIPKVTAWQLLVNEILSPFYIFQFYSFGAWYMDGYGTFALIILSFTLMSIGFTLYETLKVRKKLREMSYYEIKLTVYRKVKGISIPMTTSSLDLVPGDVIEIPERLKMPCDAILIKGSCIMNEAMLTGESIPVTKAPIPRGFAKYSAKDDKQYTLYSGTECIQTRSYEGEPVLGLVTLTGFATVKGDLIRTMLFPKSSDFEFYKDSFKFIGFLAVMAIFGFLLDLTSWVEEMKKGYDMSEKIIIKISQIITVTVPPALPTCMQIGISVAISRLLKKRIYCIAPTKINEVGRVNVMCFDKTGTLTEEGLDLLGTRPVLFDKNRRKFTFSKLVTDSEKLTPTIDKSVREREMENYASFKSSKDKESLFTKTNLFPSEILSEVMATCHSLTIVRDTMIGDPLDLKMFEATKCTIEEKSQKIHDTLILATVKSNKSEVGIVRRFEFSSKLQRMSVVVKGLNDVAFRVHMKGSPEKIRELCKPETIPPNFHTVLEKYTEDGYRVLACASKVTDVNYRQIMSVKREDIENNLTFIGFLIMENRLKPITTQIIDHLHSAQVKTIMVTGALTFPGDNALTAISVARQCHIVAPHQRVYLGDIVENKIDGRNPIVWKDFEKSENQLNQDLDPELEYGQGSIEELERVQAKRKRSHKSVLGGDTTSSVVVEENQKKLRKAPSLLKFWSNSLVKKASRIDIENPKINHPYNGAGLEEWDDLGLQQDYCLAITGRAFSFMLNEATVRNDPHYAEAFKKLLQRCLIYARMHPDEKALMIHHLKVNQKKVTGMCGDGANDVGALKTANMGISLSEAEASIAAPFTSNLQDISCVPALLREGRAALAISFQAFKFMALYSVIQFSGMTILYYRVIDFTNPQFLYQDLCMILPLAFTMTMSKTSDNLTKDLPLGRLISAPVLISFIGQSCIQIGFQVAAFLLLIRQDFFVPTDTKNFQFRSACYENMTMYLMILYQYSAVALAFMVGRPFRKPFYTNFYFTGASIILMLLNLMLTYNPFSWGFMYDQNFWQLETPVPLSWRHILFALAVANSVVTLFWELVMVRCLSKMFKADKKNSKTFSHQNSYR